MVTNFQKDERELTETHLQNSRSNSEFDMLIVYGCLQTLKTIINYIYINWNRKKTTCPPKKDLDPFNLKVSGQNLFVIVAFKLLVIV